MPKLNEDESQCRDCGVVTGDWRMGDCVVCGLGDLCPWCRSTYNRCFDCVEEPTHPKEPHDED